MVELLFGGFDQRIGLLPQLTKLFRFLCYGGGWRRPPPLGGLSSVRRRHPCQFCIVFSTVCLVSPNRGVSPLPAWKWLLWRRPDRSGWPAGPWAISSRKPAMTDFAPLHLGDRFVVQLDLALGLIRQGVQLDHYVTVVVHHRRSLERSSLRPSSIQDSSRQWNASGCGLVDLRVDFIARLLARSLSAGIPSCPLRRRIG
jgi:hypothetical protein